MTAPSPDYSSRAATLQLPSSTGDSNKRRIPCTFNGMTGKRLSISTAEALPASTAVSVEYDDRLFLGEVLTCSSATPAEGEQALRAQTAADPSWIIELKIEQILSGLQSLLALRAHLLSESVPQPLSLIPVGARN